MDETIMVDKKSFESILEVILKLMTEHEIMRAKITALHGRLEQVEGHLEQRTEPLATFDYRLKHLESRFAALDERLAESDNRLIMLAENFSSKVQAMNALQFSIPSSPQLEEAKKSFQYFLDTTKNG